MFEQFRNGYYYHYDGDLKFEWRLMYYIYVENNLRRHSHTQNMTTGAHAATLAVADIDKNKWNQDDDIT